MPRITTSLIRKAAKIDRLLPLLLPECRTINNALQELSWLKSELHPDSKISLRNACWKRSRHVPLQYILGSQPFNNISILCRPNVLIPRWETEEWTHDLISCVNNYFFSYNHYDRNMMYKSFNIVDLCTGSGCIPLSIKQNFIENYDMYKSIFNSINISAIDYSIHSTNLSKLNNKILFKSNNNTKDLVKLNIERADILNEKKISKILNNNNTNKNNKINILTCNPPYIPPENFTKEVRPSVRMYEPRIALIGDEIFYKNLVEIWLNLTDSFIYEFGQWKQFNIIKNFIMNNDNLSKTWSIGIKFDSNEIPRCIYGYRRTFQKSNSSLNPINYEKLFNGFGKLTYIAT